MKYLKSYFTDKTIEYTRKMEFAESLQQEIKEFALQGDLAGMYYMGYMLVRNLAGNRARNNDSAEEVHHGVGWLLKVVDSYESGNYHLEKGWCAEDLYFAAKDSLATIFLPKIPYLNSDIKIHTENKIDEDHDFGLRMLLDCDNEKIQNTNVAETVYIKLSLLYFSGCVVEKDIRKAKEYYQKALLEHKRDPAGNEEFLDSYGIYGKALENSVEDL